MGDKSKSKKTETEKTEEKVVKKTQSTTELSENRDDHMKNIFAMLNEHFVKAMQHVNVQHSSATQSSPKPSELATEKEEGGNEQQNIGYNILVNRSHIPDFVSLDEETVDEPNCVDPTVGEHTDNLSDISEQGMFRKSFSSRTGSIISRIYPFMQNRTVRFFAYLNFFLLLSIIILLLAIFVLLIMWYVWIFLEARLLQDENPCIFKYGPWGSCSATCWNGIVGQFPIMERQVIKESILPAAGRHRSCPDNLENLKERMPCNVYRCPKDLSSFNFSSTCFFYDIRKGVKCYRIRQFDELDQLVNIDGELVEECDNTQCPEFHSHDAGW